MISNTTERLFIVHSNILTKNVFSPCKEFYIDLWSFQLPNDCPLWPYFYGKFCIFFKCSLNLRVHALQSELNKVKYTNFGKFQLQRMTLKIEQAFVKMTKYIFVFILATPTLTSFFPRTFSLHFFYILYLKSSLNLWDEYHFFIFQ